MQKINTHFSIKENNNDGKQNWNRKISYTGKVSGIFYEDSKVKIKFADDDYLLADTIESKVNGNLATGKYVIIIIQESHAAGAIITDVIQNN